jgi:hypothetical protein
MRNQLNKMRAGVMQCISLWNYLHTSMYKIDNQVVMMCLNGNKQWHTFSNLLRNRSPIKTIIMKTAINYLQDVRYRALDNQLSRKEAVVFCLTLFTVITLGFYLFAPHGLN